MPHQRGRGLGRDALFVALAVAAVFGAAYAADAVAPEPKGPQETAEEPPAYHSAAPREGPSAEMDEAYIDETIRMEDERNEAALPEQGYYREDVPLD